MNSWAVGASRSSVEDREQVEWGGKGSLSRWACAENQGGVRKEATCKGRRSGSRRRLLQKIRLGEAGDRDKGFP